MIKISEVMKISSSVLVVAMTASVACAATQIDKSGVDGIKSVEQAKSIYDNGMSALDGQKWIGLDLGSSYTTISNDEPTGTKLKHEPIVMADVQLSILRNKVFQWTYKRSGENAEDRDNAQKNAAKVMKLQGNINRILPSVPIQVSYSKQVFNTYVTTGSLRDVYLVGENNTTAASGTFYATDPGVIAASSGQKLGLKTTRDRFELLYVQEKPVGVERNIDPEIYFGVFWDKLKKPWEDPTTTWVNGTTGNSITVVYGDALLETKGITVGKKTELENGWNWNAASFDIGKTSVALTKNYSLSDRMKGSNYSIWKYGISSEFTYKNVIAGDRISYYATIFGRFDGYYVSQNDSSNSSSNSSSDNSIAISHDRLFGVKAGLYF